jgi:hypothetical protein
MDWLAGQHAVLDDVPAHLRSLAVAERVPAGR